MLLGRPEFSVRFLFPTLVIFISLVFIAYQWSELVSNPYRHLLRLHDYLSTPDDEVDIVDNEVDPELYRELYSASSADKKYFFIDFVDQRGINPNIIPHPILDDTWVVVAQRHDPDTFGKHPMVFAELTCSAVFQNGTLQCLKSPSLLPIETSPGAGKCQGDYVVLNINQGPHDARLFYGPEAAYMVYGSNSDYNCFGQWIQNFASVMEWGYATFPDAGGFDEATELQRPLPYGNIEKNWFLFWDSDGHAYAHYDVSPKRSFAALQPDGSVGQDLAPQAALAGDETCLSKYMPRLGPGKESIHQATNSLSITLCKRADPLCEPDEKNTFIMSIFQHKRYQFFHSVYEPYAMLFRREAPFTVHGVSTKPYWIHGRWRPRQTEKKPDPDGVEARLNGTETPNWNQTEMFYITSMSWKNREQKYHGYIDDIVFLGFGIEDSHSAGMDVVVGDMLLDIGLC